MEMYGIKTEYNIVKRKTVGKFNSGSIGNYLSYVF